MKISSSCKEWRLHFAVPTLLSEEIRICRASRKTLASGLRGRASPSQGGNALSDGSRLAVSSVELVPTN